MMYQYQCPNCLMRFCTYSAEAKHRHNYPLFCRKPSLTTAQKRAKSHFKPGMAISANEINERVSTLRALVKKRYLRELDDNMFTLEGENEKPQTQTARHTTIQTQSE